MLTFEFDISGVLRLIGFSVAFLLIYITRPIDIFERCRFLIAYIKLLLIRKKATTRFPQHDIAKTLPTMQDLGFIAHPDEFKWENPQKNSNNELSDGVHFIGVDAENNFLDVAVIDIGNEVANVWIVLKLSDGSVYELPNQPDTRVPYVRNEHVFSAGGLSIQCHSPLRRWRISFNGLLRKTDQAGNTSDQKIHVKFSFIWMSCTLVHDNAQQYNPYSLAKSISLELPNDVRSNLIKFGEIRNTYEQWGQLIGTIQVSGETEKELYLWSLRERHLENPVWESDLNFRRIFLYFKSGTPLKLEVTSLKGLMSSFFNGYTVTAGGKENEVKNCTLQFQELSESKSLKKVFFAYTDEDGQHNVVISRTDFRFYLLLGSHNARMLNINYIKARIDNEEDGYGILINGSKSPSNFSSNFDSPNFILKDRGHTLKKNIQILHLEHELCQSTLVAGGKGCSLALLKKLSENFSDFRVPDGFVVTAEAFKKHIENHSNLAAAIKNLVTSSSENCDLKNACEKCSLEFETTELSSKLKSEIAVEISKFSQAESVKFAVRSSALGEDSEDLSAAGQMLTVLGVTGIENIYKAIIKCWASHFRYEAVEYNRQYGQPLDSSMAVVIQEMVQADVAGVMFTVDPLSGDPTYPCITANFGLGETVVSSSAEPDTYILKRNNSGTVDFYEMKIGEKRKKMIMLDDGGTEEVSSNCKMHEACLTQEMALKICQAGLVVEKYFCSHRDIEWAIKDDNLFLLQARPITTIHGVTEFELTHELDTPTRSSYEYWTRANTGEVFFGACSPLGISLVVLGMDIYGQRSFLLRQKPRKFSYLPYYSHWLPATHRQICLSIIDTLFRTNKKNITTAQRAFEIALFGRTIMTENMHKCGVKKFGYITTTQNVLSKFSLLYFSFKISKIIESAHKRVWDYYVPLESFTKPTEVYDSIQHQMQFYGEVSGVHGLATYLSSFYNVLILSLLAKKKVVWDNELYCDFAMLLSSCSDVESADVPSSLQNLAKAIYETNAIAAAFTSSSAEVAQSLLQNDKGISGKLFKDFLHKHGHRCLKEFDVYSVSWAMKPETLIKILQNMVASPNVLSKEKQSTSIDEAIRNLKTPLSKSSKFLLKHVLPWSRKAVGHREKTKSIIIKVVDWFRRSCYRLSDLLVHDGFLPKKELLFFLTFEEIKVLMRTRDPNLISRAMRRCRIHPKLDALKFPEIITGVPKPITDAADYDEDQYLSTFELEGTPVCAGVVKAKARVVLSVDKAVEIKQGEILVTYSTDIGWSPYFPLVSGVITVLGGLISHGAVVAREYGLPCVVGVQGATALIKTGDLIVLDGSRGKIMKVQECVNTEGGK